MQRKLTINYPGSSTLAEFLFDIPTKCPICGNNMIPTVVYRHMFGESENHTNPAIVLFRCSFEECFKFFIQEYEIQHSSHYEYIGPVKYNLVPPIKSSLPEEIKKISHDFSETYNQSLQAELLGMNQIAGIGMRRSIEFLVKDYLINIKGKDPEITKAKWLSAAIKDIEFEQIRSLATAATWIGNDETHYVREWKDKDIDDMKAFIRSAALFISADYQTIQSSEMIEQKKLEKQQVK